MNFEGTTTVVTGAANGIGAALSRRFHAAGARVVVADRESVITEAIAVIDKALAEMLRRELVSAVEVGDLLLDLRTLLSASAATTDA